MCEETANHLWDLQDVLGHGATSQVYKAYNKTTGVLVAAKVYQVSSNSRPAQAGGGTPNKDYRPILDREMDILKAADHENIIRYIALEPVISSDDPRASNDREALLIEYCNGGSLHHVLEAPENRYGLMEDDFMLVFKHLTNALKYLHDKHTIHRDIKPDNIMLSVNINGERTYKLADLGVARLINEGENAFTSLVGTEEYIHPELYRAAVHDNRTNALRTALQTRVDFPFEVDLWSLGVTLYQCATGELPFQPFAGTRKDRAIMRRILDTKPTGVISGIEQKAGGEIQWSNTLPDSCRLSTNLKKRLESLLRRLLESDRNKLMTFREFFNETDRIFSLMPIYYLNLKRFHLSCSYFEGTQPISKLYEELHEQNSDQNGEEYHCLFQNVPYPIAKPKSMSIRTFCEQLPTPTSRETPLVFYTFSPLAPGDTFSPSLYIPKVKAIRQFNDVAAACEWSKDTMGLFFYIKNQLIDYQRILQTAQCSTTVMQQHLKSNLLEFLCLIREKLIVFRAIEELKHILDQIDSHSTHITPPTSNRTASVSSVDGPSIGFSHLFNNNNNNNNTSSADNSLSPVTTHRTSSATSMQLIHQSIRIYLRSYRHLYDKLKTCEQDTVELMDREFAGQVGCRSDDQQPFVRTLWLSHRTKMYSSWIHRADKFLKDLMDLHESFRKDRLLNTYNRLQSDSHFRRRKNLEQLHEQYVHFALEECSPSLIQVFHDYNDWIAERSKLIERFQSIEQSYDKQCEEIMNYAELIDELRQVVYKNLRELTGTSMSASNEQLNSPPVTSMSTETSQPAVSSGEEETASESSANPTLMKRLRGRTRKHLHQAEEGFLKLDHVIRQLRTNIQKK